MSLRMEVIVANGSERSGRNRAGIPELREPVFNRSCPGRANGSHAELRRRPEGGRLERRAARRD